MRPRLFPSWPSADCPSPSSQPPILPPLPLHRRLHGTLLYKTSELHSTFRMPRVVELEPISGLVGELGPADPHFHQNSNELLGKSEFKVMKSQTVTRLGFSTGSRSSKHRSASPVYSVLTELGNHGGLGTRMGSYRHGSIANDIASPRNILNIGRLSGSGASG